MADGFLAWLRPDFNPVEGLWAHIKRSLATRTLNELDTLLRGTQVVAIPARHPQRVPRRYRPHLDRPN
ncbi:hypothetical protein ABZ312_17355 [Streptomyces sp. NPDC006207]